MVCGCEEIEYIEQDHITWVAAIILLFLMFLPFLIFDTIYHKISAGYHWIFNKKEWW